MIERPSLRMSGAEFAAHRQLLGLTLAEMGERLGVRGDTIKRWESERDATPHRVPAELLELLAEHAALADRIAGSDTPVYLRRGDGWALGAAARALEIEPDVMLEWL